MRILGRECNKRKKVKKTICFSKYKLSPHINHYLKNDFDGYSRRFLKRASENFGLGLIERVTVTVCFCASLSLNPMRTLEVNLLGKQVFFCERQAR